MPPGHIQKITVAVREREEKIKIRSKANIENETFFLEIGENENVKQVPALDECTSSYQHLYRRIQR